MAVQTHIYLPSDVRCLDVAKAVAILAGLSPRATDYGFRVEGLQIRPASAIPGLAVEIVLAGSMIDGATEHRFWLSYESSDFCGHDREICVLSTAFWVAIGRRLIGLFGGALLYTDHGNTDPEESRLRRWAYPREADDAGRLELASRIFKLKPLTVSEVNSAADHSFYDGREG